MEKPNDSSLKRIRLALAGDTMLGRGVAEVLVDSRPSDVIAPEVVEIAGSADLFILNLECCISVRGSPRPDPGKPFFFRAPPVAAELLQAIGVDCVTLANNHALDFGPVALDDTLDLLADVGIDVVGAGRDQTEARRSSVLSHGGFSLEIMGFTDHPPEFAAGPESPGVAFADLSSGVPAWLEKAIRSSTADATLVTPHWGPNMTIRPVNRVKRAADALVAARATLVAGHSAHVFHGVSDRVLFDLGDFVDDYAVDPELRNDLGLLFLIELTHDGPMELEVVPLALDYCHTRLAVGDEADWILRRFRHACHEMGTEVSIRDGRPVIRW
ncbi:MAG: CapA family protein [Acidimicrobiia bacterium]